MKLKYVYEEQIISKKNTIISILIFSGIIFIILDVITYITYNKINYLPYSIIGYIILIPTMTFLCLLERTNITRNQKKKKWDKKIGYIIECHHYKRTYRYSHIEKTSITILFKEKKYTIKNVSYNQAFIGLQKMLYNIKKEKQEITSEIPINVHVKNKKIYFDLSSVHIPSTTIDITCEYEDNDN